jgi:hypothetical protein
MPCKQPVRTLGCTPRLYRPCTASFGTASLRTGRSDDLKNERNHDREAYWRRTAFTRSNPCARMKQRSRQDVDMFVWLGESSNVNSVNRQPPASLMARACSFLFAFKQVRAFWVRPNSAVFICFSSGSEYERPSSVILLLLHFCPACP